MAETKNKISEREWKLIQRMIRKDSDLQVKVGKFITERLRIKHESEKILAMLRDDECSYNDFAALPPVDGKILLSLLVQVDITALDKAKQIQSEWGTQGSNKRHAPSRATKAEFIDFWRKNQPMSRNRAAKYYAEHHPDGTERKPKLIQETVRRWLQGVDIAP
ncbi:MAG: hypothetical protein B7Y07_02405 [Halothiobacillus sp. 24-54-40]|jgi:hypothetical protein|nr:MAG: hypothetical protein B7Y58_10745 [Halothiobacillus sp. 35-54-62]OYZ87997.1 MAG: hypothetical protein B7Y07_02405 [Halothiobacillus sp. 24-54-40]OZA78903.1 MAG: hypothetical protein B7X64_11840 [Halothiobacillus sp. 39-53-45]HQS03928.1 hypothetical protein [Halothiobacillus sp.]HQS30091.1 hypothetical protein [Halothiobacillus sp.]